MGEGLCDGLECETRYVCIYTQNHACVNVHTYGCVEIMMSETIKIMQMTVSSLWAPRSKTWCVCVCVIICECVGWERVLVSKS